MNFDLIVRFSKTKFPTNLNLQYRKAQTAIIGEFENNIRNLWRMITEMSYEILNIYQALNIPLVRNLWNLERSLAEWQMTAFFTHSVTTYYFRIDCNINVNTCIEKSDLKKSPDSKNNTVKMLINNIISLITKKTPDITLRSKILTKYLRHAPYLTYSYPKCSFLNA